MNLKIFEMINNTNDETKVINAEQMLRYIHRILEPEAGRIPFGERNRISWEIFAQDGRIRFYVVVPERLSQFIKQKICLCYPQADLIEVQDYSLKFNPNHTFCTRLNCSNHFVFSTKMDFTDIGLNSILNSISNLRGSELILVQIVLMPINNKWQAEAYRKYRKIIFEGHKPIPGNLVKDIGIGLVNGVVKFSESVLSTVFNMDFSNVKYQNTQIEREEIKNSTKKIALPGYQVEIRLLAGNDNYRNSEIRLNSLASAFSAFDGDNELRRDKVLNREKFIEQVKNREISKWNSNNKLCIAELAQFVRLPNKHIVIPELKQKEIKTFPIPEECLKDGIYLGEGIHNGTEINTYIPTNRIDDVVHPLIITGGMGAGKTTLLINLTLGRIEKGYSVIVVDTEGDLSKDLIMRIPDKYFKNTLWLNFGDLQYPIPLDLLEPINIEGVNAGFVKDWAINELISHFRKMYGQNWGPATEWLTMNNLRIILETGGNFIEVFRMLTDSQFRDEVIPKIKYVSPMTYSFWRNFQDNLSEPQKSKLTMPSINKIGPFIENRIVRNIICQGNQPYSFIERLNKAQNGMGNITIITIPKGILIGTWNLLGGILISKIWLSALVRSNQTQLENRHPCFLTIDEVEDLVSSNFPIMLSQSRKRRLGLTFAYQYISQLNKETRNAIFGNRPHILAMKPGNDDATFYNDLFDGYYNINDLKRLPNYHIVPIINISGIATNPFIVKTREDILGRSKLELNNELKLKEVWENTKKQLKLKYIDEVEKVVYEKQSYLRNIIIEKEVEIVEDFEVDESILNILRRG